jgi:pimeloyl-ACP methyl ester carboxylesterase
MPFAASERAEIYYERHGAGPALVFAHGAGGNTLSWWQQVAHFADRYTVLTFDHRGFGRSRCAPGDFLPGLFPADLLAVLDAEAIERAGLVCQSLGGWTGLRTALLHPRRVACLVLCDTPGGLWTPAVRDALARIGQRADREGIRGSAALAPDYARREPAKAFLYEQINALNGGFDPTLLQRLFETEARIAPEALAGFAVPTLMIAGGRDLLFPVEALHEAASLLPGCAVRDFPDAGHSVYFEEPAAFNRVVDDFVSRHGSASRGPA